MESLSIFFKTAERKKPLSEKAVDVGAPMLTGSVVGRTLADLSLSTSQGASPRRKTVGTLVGALGGFGWHKAQTEKEKRRKAYRESLKKTAALVGKTPSQFLGMASKSKSIHQLAPKIGRKGLLPKVGPK
jgi:hypothetical protein